MIAAALARLGFPRPWQKKLADRARVRHVTCIQISRPGGKVASKLTSLTKSVKCPTDLL
jgi:hypothetical protein